MWNKNNEMAQTKTQSHVYDGSITVIMHFFLLKRVLLSLMKLKVTKQITEEDVVVRSNSKLECQHQW